MHDEKPGEPRIDGRPFDGGTGPTAQSAEGLPIGKPQLNEQQPHSDTAAPSRKTPKKERARWSAQRIVVLVILLAILALVIYLKIVGVV
jgi:hypothetical protein